MKNIALYTLIGLLIFLTSCSKEGDLGSSSKSKSSGNGPANNAGLITAGEWNDLENWSFWNELIRGEDYSSKPSYWGFFNNNRVSIHIKNNNLPVIDAKVHLLKEGNIVWEARSDNFGKAEMWIDLFQENHSIDINAFSLQINGQPVNAELKLFPDGVNEIEFNTQQNVADKVELCFIVDATGSMGDELKFLKDDLADVIQKVKANDASLNVYTSSVFYRDEKDKYVVRNSKFTDDLNTTIDFIKKQSAAGGGDFPEAVHSGLKLGIEELQWSESAKTRIAFLLLDAPPHHKPEVIGTLQHSIKEAAKKGIKVIPISASGIDKNTEFLMRFFAISTNSTYVFITNDSGIGDDHIKASVGAYEVEYLNDLMVRLISKYSE